MSALYFVAHLGIDNEGRFRKNKFTTKEIISIPNCELNICS